MPKFIDLTGQKFGKLTVIERYDVIKNGETRWLCNCDCGNKNIIVNRGSLKSGCTLSCGCLQKERIKQKLKKHNKYNLNGDFGIGWTTNTNKEFYFDLEDYDKIKDYTWFENDQEYILSTKNNNFKKQIRLHRLIMNVLNHNDIEIDHKNTIRYDNRKDNLRYANKQTNGINRNNNKNNKLGIKGVCKIGEKYYPRIMKDGKTYYFGGFIKLEDAIKIHKEKEIEFFGEFSYKEGENIIE